MRASVASILDLPQIRRANPEVLSGMSRLDQSVRWLHASDALDLRGLLKGDELILSSGVPLAGSRADGLAYLRALEECGAVGLIVSTLGEEPDLEARIRDVAQRTEFPVVLLDDRVPFIEITEACHSLLLLGRVMADVMDGLPIDEVDPTMLLERISDLLHAPVVLEDSAHHVLAYATVGTPLTEVLSGWVRRSRQVASSPKPSVDSATGWVQAPLVEEGRSAGRLVIPMEVDTDIAPALLARVSSALTRRWQGEGSPGVRLRAASAAFEDVRRGVLTAHDDVMARVNAVGFPATTWSVPVVFVRGGEASSGRPRPATHDLAADIHAAAAELRIPVLYGSISDRAVGAIVAIRERSSVPTTAEQFMKAFTRRHSSREGTMNHRVAWGSATPDLLEALGTGIDETMGIADSSLSLRSPEKGYFVASDVQFRRLLWALRRQPQVPDFIDTMLGQLLRDAPELLPFVEGYIELNGNMAQLAQRFFLSRPSAYARLRRVESILGSPLSNLDTRAAVHLAITFHSFLELDPESVAQVQTEPRAARPRR